MEICEFSFVRFDDSMIRGRMPIVGSLASLRQFSVNYYVTINLAAFDCRRIIEVLKENLRVRMEEFPARKQVLIILYNNPNIHSIQIKYTAYNKASFVTDVRKWCPKNEKIDKNSDLSAFRSTKMNTIPNFQELKKQSLFIDNYIYYLALKDLQKDGVFCLLLHIGTEATEKDLTNVCNEITSMITS